MPVHQVAPLTCTCGLQSPAVNSICLQRSACSPLLAACSLEQQQDQPALSKTSTVLFVQCHCISQKTCELFLGIFYTLTWLLSWCYQCAAQFCSFFFLREEDSITIQLGHAGRDGPGSWAEFSKSSPHFEFETSSALEVLVPSCRLWKSKTHEEKT